MTGYDTDAKARATAHALIEGYLLSNLDAACLVSRICCGNNFCGPGAAFQPSSRLCSW
jgi:hypothetical protein